MISTSESGFWVEIKMPAEAARKLYRMALESRSSADAKVTVLIEGDVAPSAAEAVPAALSAVLNVTKENIKILRITNFQENITVKP